jgi:hypothetical protein
MKNQIMKNQKRIAANSFYMMIVVCLLVSACAPKQGQIATNNQTISAVKKEIKPGAPVTLDSPALININANQATNINLALKTTTTLGNMRVDIIPGDGLQLLNKNSAYKLVLDGSPDYSLATELLAPNNGRFYLNLHISLDNGETISSRTLAVIVQVGPSAEESVQSDKLLKTLTGEHVISMPAEETVIRK